jgi:dual specificity tyrosine-phosphorylation-regulated kinase 2/3/4
MLSRNNGGLKSPSGPDNYGFDNDQQEYLCDIHDHLAYRFEIVKRIGKGSFGQVFKCFDHKEKEFVALKILKNKKRLYK